MSLIEDVRKFVVDNFLFGDDGGLGDDTSFMEGGIIDSTGILELIAFLEKTFGVKIEDGELVPENLDSLARVAQFIERKKTA